MAKTIAKRLEQEEWYQALVEECRAIITEAIFTSRWALVEGHWNLGKRVREDKQVKKYAKGSKTFVQDLARKLNISERTLYYSLQAYDKYSDLNKIPEGKNISWNKIITKYLPLPKEYRKENEWMRTFDVWNFASIDGRYGIECPGRIPYQIVANVLHYFTNKGDKIVDPMAGGGVLIDVCKEMKREYKAYDIYPRRNEIIKKDLKEGFDEEAKNCDLIFMDPPYWKKKEEDYIEGSISRLDRKEYLDFFKELIPKCKTILRPKGYFAFLMSNYIDYQNSQNSIFTADYYRIFIDNGFIPIIEIQCPLSTQQYAGFDVVRAQKEKKILIISRSLYVWENTKEVNS